MEQEAILTPATFTATLWRCTVRVLTTIPVAKFATRYNLFMAVLSFSRFLAGQGLLDEAKRAKPAPR